MNRYGLVIGLLFFADVTCAAVDTAADPASRQLCTEVWYRTIDKQIPTSTTGKHGPEVGSNEWKAAIETKLKVRGKQDLPERDTEGWCRYIDELVQGSGSTGGVAVVSGPSYSCDNVKPDSIAAAICNDRELSALDRKLAAVYAEAQKKAASKPGSALTNEQNQWIEGRNKCLHSEDSTACVRDLFFRRIAELEAGYELVAGIGPAYYHCKNTPAAEIVIMFFETDPRTLVARRGSSTALMFEVPSGSGSRYQGGNETFWERDNEATIVWGAGAAEMVCNKAS